MCSMRCLVIGGNGFIGSHLVDCLVRRGHEVSVFDRFSDGLPKYEAQGVGRHQGDFLNLGDLEKAIRGTEAVFHFLSTTTPVSTQTDPVVDIRTNVSSTVDLLRLCVDLGVEQLYFASSGGAIYGNREVQPISEDAPTEPISPYAIGKQTIEGYLRYFRQGYGLRSTALRISNPYGPRQSPRHRQGVIPIFLQHVVHGEPITIYGDGSMVRDYLYVTDAAEMIVSIAGSEARHSVYNIGSGEGSSLKTVLGVIRDVTGVSPTIEFRDKPATFVDRVVLSTDRYRSEFGELNQVTTLPEGVSRTWAEVEHRAAF